MANEWLRLWHDMPNDPKFKTVARISKQPISLVLSVYLHLLVDASRNVTRGYVTVTNEDLSSALDVEEDQIKAIDDAMQGRLKNGNYLTGWESRQIKKEDIGNENTGAKSAAERKREERERKKKAEVTGCHDESRNVTLDKDKDKDKDKEKNINNTPPKAADVPDAKPKKYDFSKELIELGVESKVVDAWMQVRKAKKATNSEIALDALRREAAKAGLSIADAVRTCVEKSWSGLDAEWLRPKSQASPNKETIGEKNARITAQVLGRQYNTGMIIEMEKPNG